MKLIEAATMSSNDQTKKLCRMAQWAVLNELK